MCGKLHACDARTAFDLALTFVNGNSKITLLIVLIKQVKFGLQPLRFVIGHRCIIHCKCTQDQFIKFRRQKIFD